MKNLIPVTAILVTVLAVGTIVEGTLSERWVKVKSQKLEEFALNLDDVPKTFGHWVGVDDELTPEKEVEFKASNCRKSISRTYRNRDGERVNVYLVAGTARHVTIHTPDWCYVGAGYEMIGGESNQYTDNEARDLDPFPEYLTAIFRKEEPLFTHNIRIFWSFSDDGVWRGPRMPKPTYAGKKALYKIYMITEIDEAAQTDVSQNPTLKFAREFLPILNNVLFRERPEIAELAAGDA